MKRYLTPLLLFVAPLLSAQISAPGSNTSRLTAYPSGGEVHPIFIYCASSGVQPSLNAESPGGSAPFSFEWSQWNPASSDFSISLGSDNGISSQRNSLAEGGYRVRISDGGGYDTSLVAWVHIDSPVALAQLMNNNCYYVALDGTAATDPYYYDDIVTGADILLPNDVAFLWSSSPASSIPYPDLEIDPITYSPPLVDVDYNLMVTDSFGCVSEDSFFYESIHVNAEFEIDPDRGEAPLEVFITDKSVRGSIYLWRFGDDSLSTESSPGSHTYYIPGQYTIRLMVESDRGCVDSMKIDGIIVDPSSLDIPNVFTPDGDNRNDFFYVQSTSLRSISVQVFSKGGKRVYYYSGEGDQLKEWQGWDGKIGSSNASPGIYYYIIKARGWDNVNYDGEEYRGFVYLYR